MLTGDYVSYRRTSDFARTATINSLVGFLSQIYITIEPYRNTFMFGNFSWQLNDENDQVREPYFESLSHRKLMKYSGRELVGRKTDIMINWFE